MRDRFVSAAFRRLVATATALLLMAATWCGRALAQSAAAGSGTGSSSSGNLAQGTLGGAMLGAEVVMLSESAFRLRPAWMYMVGGGAGALAGGYLGYRIGDGSSNKPPSFLLAGGIALIIPTIMGVLTATEYAPPESFRPTPSDKDSSDKDSSDDGDARAPLELELPDVGLAQAFSRDELARHRIHPVTELHLLLRGAF
jgi:hypothetical protein